MKKMKDQIVIKFNDNIEGANMVVRLSPQNDGIINRPESKSIYLHHWQEQKLKKMIEYKKVINLSMNGQFYMTLEEWENFKKQIDSVLYK